MNIPPLEDLLMEHWSEGVVIAKDRAMQAASRAEKNAWFSLSLAAALRCIQIFATKYQPK